MDAEKGTHKDSTAVLDALVVIVTNLHNEHAGAISPGWKLVLGTAPEDTFAYIFHREAESPNSPSSVIRESPPESLVFVYETLLLLVPHSIR